MTVEAELAQLLMRMGTERGLDAETILSEMARAPLPSFVDANAVRGSMLEAVETWWRADLEERLGQLRQQFQMGGAVVTPAAARPAPVIAPSRPAPAANAAPAASNQPVSDPAPPIDDATLHEEPELANEPSESAEALPKDATMIWNTNHG